MPPSSERGALMSTAKHSETLQFTATLGKFFGPLFARQIFEANK
jgi:hypothetical protein